jgi:uncharacterized protein YifE (UPF0438 family)
MSDSIDTLRDHYLSKGPLPYDLTVKKHFTVSELAAIEKYGHWFSAIWEDQVPLASDKLKHFYLAKNKLFDSRTRLENLWFRYDSLVVPF